MAFPQLKNIKQFQITAQTGESSSESKTYSISFKKFIFYVSLCSAFVFILGYFIIHLIVYGSVFYSRDYLNSIEEQNKLLELNKKILFLSKEIEELKTTNERLKYAIMIGDSTLLKADEDSALHKNPGLKKKAEGNVFAVFIDLLNKFFSKDDNNFFTRPAEGFISREFNPDEGHLGIDIVSKTGSPIYAAGSGYVIFADYTINDGYMIIIVHPNDYISIYKHCSSLLKKNRERVVQGELIALSGNTGHKSHGPHLHFEIWKNGKPLNPLILFNN